MSARFASDTHPMRKLIAGRRVLITGAGGATGSELSRWLLAFEPAALGLLERHEKALEMITQDLKRRSVSVSIAPILGDVTDIGRVDGIIGAARPHIVFHSAAHNHAALMELHPCEAVRNNVGGTRIVSEAAALYGVEHFTLVSTDKVTSPTSVLGATKAMAELAVSALVGDSRTMFLQMRFRGTQTDGGRPAGEQVAAPSTPELFRYEVSAPERREEVLRQVGELMGVARSQDDGAMRRLLGKVAAHLEPATTTPLAWSAGTDLHGPAGDSDESVSDEPGIWPPPQLCPKCLGVELFRSPARSPWERMRKMFAAERLFRCRNCGWRGWTMVLEPPAVHQPPDRLSDTIALDSLVPARERYAKQIEPATLISKPMR